MRKYSRLSSRWWIGIVGCLLLMPFMPFGRADQNDALTNTTTAGASELRLTMTHNIGKTSYFILTEITPIESTGISALPLKAETQEAARPNFSSPTANEDDNPFPPGPGRDLTLKVCSGCHSTAIIAKQHLSEQEWSDLVQVMSARGAVATDKELSEITAYLAKSFPPQTAPQR